MTKGDDINSEMKKAVDICLKSATRFIQQHPLAPMLRKISLRIDRTGYAISCPEDYLSKMMHEHFEQDARLAQAISRASNALALEFPSLVWSVEADIRAEGMVSTEKGKYFRLDEVDFKINALEAGSFPRAMDRLEKLSNGRDAELSSPDIWLILKTSQDKLQFEGARVEARSERDAALIFCAVQFGRYGLEAIETGNGAEIAHWFDEFSLVRAPGKRASDLLFQREMEPSEPGPEI